MERVTFYFAVKTGGGKGVGGYLNYDGDVGRNNNARSTDRSVIEAVAELAALKHPDWIVEVRESSAPACHFN